MHKGEGLWLGYFSSFACLSYLHNNLPVYVCKVSYNYLILFCYFRVRNKIEAVYEPAAFFTVSIKAHEGFQILVGSNMTNLRKRSWSPRSGPLAGAATLA